MTHSDIERPPTYTGMQVGGWIASAAGSIGLSILLTVGIATRVFLPTGFASLTMGASIVGAILLVGRFVLRQGDGHRLDTLQSTTAIFDEMRIIRDELAADRSERVRLANLVERTLLREAEIRELLAKSRTDTAEARKAVERTAGRQDEILAMMAEQAQRYDHAIATMRAALESAVERLAGAEEDVAHLVSDVRGLQSPPAAGLSLVPKTRLDPPTSGKID